MRMGDLLLGKRNEGLTGKLGSDGGVCVSARL